MHRLARRLLGLPVRIEAAPAAAGGALSSDAFASIVEDAFAHATSKLCSQLCGPLRSRLPGVIAAYADCGTLQHAHAVGSDGAGCSLAPDAPFRIASQSKPVTALLALRMVDLGLLQLDTPVWPALRAWTPSAEQTRGFDHTRITLRHLLNHTSGWSVPRFPSRPWRVNPRGLSTVALLNGKAGEDAVPRMLFNPGERTEYSAAGFSIIELLLEQAGEASFETLLRRHVAEPLGLSVLHARYPAPDDPRFLRGMTSPPECDIDEERFFLARAPSGMTSTVGELAVMAGTLAAASRGRSSFLSHAVARDTFVPPGPNLEQFYFGFGFALTKRGPRTHFKHSGYSPGLSSVTEGVVGGDSAVTVLATIANPEGKTISEHISRAILDALSSGR